MRHALVLVALVLLPAAVAGSEVSPDVDDFPDQEDPRLDLLAAWVENEPGGVRFTVKIATIEETATDFFYFLGFDQAGASRLAAVSVDAEGDIVTYLGPQGPGRNGEPPEGIANGALDKGTLRTGSPGYATAVIPLEPGTRLENLSAGTSQYQRERARWADVDFRQTDRAFVAERTVVPTAISSRALLVAGAAVIFVAGVAGGVAFGVWRARRAPEEPAARGVEVREEENGPRPRFSLKPK